MPRRNLTPDDDDAYPGEDTVPQDAALPEDPDEDPDEDLDEDDLDEDDDVNEAEKYPGQDAPPVNAAEPFYLDDEDLAHGGLVHDIAGEDNDQDEAVQPDAGVLEDGEAVRHDIRGEGTAEYTRAGAGGSTAAYAPEDEADWSELDGADPLRPGVIHDVPRKRDGVYASEPEVEENAYGGVGAMPDDTEDDDADEDGS